MGKLVELKMLYPMFINSFRAFRISKMCATQSATDKKGIILKI